MELSIISPGNQYTVKSAYILRNVRRFELICNSSTETFTVSISLLSVSTSYSENSCRELWDIFNEQDSEALTAWKLTYGSCTV